VATDVDTFLVTVYCLVDDLYRKHASPIRVHLPGRPGELSDSEVLTLELLAQWQPSGSQRQFVKLGGQPLARLFSTSAEPECVQSTFTPAVRRTGSLG